MITEINIIDYGCGFCGVIMSMFVVHFVFRFFALERKGNLKYFEGWFFICWLAVPIFMGFIWAQTVLAFLHEDPESSEYMREILLQNYNLTIPEIMYVGVLYHKKTADGKDILNYKGIQGVCILGTIMTIIPVFFMIVPLSIYFFSPLFHLGFQIIGDVTTFTTALYPIIDPLPVIFVIDNYRNAVFEFFGCLKAAREVNINVTSSSVVN
ncbi:hypothetical protein GCK72_013219 [Caenorhabditis remanei]|uniref:Uncharacterized protein n=1 Tax=Caenorhabditis remanei TaxID=31234 RepID=A0A6A5GQG3_CAERE|nr:hypothetical protein GCK72_013219 [Caenorhabditis remanei]KAF1756765.1 hypothetical protein GCK72_013219 [Caenorhabditis remanei]